MDPQRRTSARTGAPAREVPHLHWCSLHWMDLPRSPPRPPTAWEVQAWRKAQFGRTQAGGAKRRGHVAGGDTRYGGANFFLGRPRWRWRAREATAPDRVHAGEQAEAMHHTTPFPLVSEATPFIFVHHRTYVATKNHTSSGPCMRNFTSAGTQSPGGECSPQHGRGCSRT